jgi:hypothetical protein
MRMHFLAILLSACAFAAGVPAQAATPESTPATPTSNTPAAKPTPASAIPPTGGELIKAAGAATHDGPPVMRAARRPVTDDREHRNGTAMLLAGLALMAGIALRRFNARKH